MNELKTETENLNCMIEWDGAIGVEDCCDICTKRMVWWIWLNNDQIAKVADVHITINPFPPKGKPHLCGYRYLLSRPSVKTPTEQNAYAEAVYRAGVWAGEILANASKRDENNIKVFT